MIQILNPIYDSSFKYLMSDEKVARRVSMTGTPPRFGKRRDSCLPHLSAARCIATMSHSSSFSHFSLESSLSLANFASIR